MAANVRGPNTKRKHLSKNKKKSWRKVNIDDVEDFLEDQRLQERTGGLVSEKKDEDLFYVDKATVKPKKEPKTRLQQKRKAQEYLKKLDSALAPPPPKKDKRCSQVVEKITSGKKSLRQIQQAKDRKKSKIDRIKKRKATAFARVATYDLWEDSPDQSNDKADPHYLKITKKTRVQVPDHRSVSKLKAVQLPHAGSSYNPAYDDYQELLLKAHTKEVTRKEEEDKLHRALVAKFPTADKAPTEASVLKEMSAGLFEEDNKDKDDKEGEDVGDLDRISVNPPVRRENKKDEKQRRKEKERKMKEKEAQESKADKQKEVEFFRLKKIKAELKQREKRLTERSLKRQQFKAGALYRTNRLGKLKYEDPDEAVKLSEELVGSLRELKPEGNLLEDRFKSLQKRNVIEPRLRARFRRRYKPKFYDKKANACIKESTAQKS